MAKKLIKIQEYVLKINILLVLLLILNKTYNEIENTDLFYPCVFKIFKSFIFEK